MAELSTLSALLGPTEYLNSGLLTNNKAYYRFEAGALTTDSSGEAHTLTAIGDPAEGTGKFGGGVDLDGNDAYSATDHADFKPTGAFTIGAWVKTSGPGIGASYYVFTSTRRTANVTGIGIQIRNDGTNTYLEISSARNTGTTLGTNYQVASAISTVVVNNAWHLVVGLWDTTSLKLYLDGILIATTAWTNAPAYDASNGVRVGCRLNDVTNEHFFTGSIDDVFLINGTALTADQISTLYGATAYWRMEGNFNDSKGSRNASATNVSYGTGYGKYGQGAALIASSLATFTSITPVSISWWWYPTSGGGVFMRHSSNNHNFLEANIIYDGSTRTIPVTVRITNEWHHYVAVYSGGKYLFYRDGEYLTEVTANQLALNRFGRQDPANNCQDGYLDDVATFSRTLTTAEILQLYKEQSSSGFFALLGGL